MQTRAGTDKYGNTEAGVIQDPDPRAPFCHSPPHTHALQTCLRLRILGKRAQPADHVDNKIFLQGEVGVTNTL